MWQIMYTDSMATKSMNATKPINYYRTVPFIATCMGKALHDLSLCMDSTTHTHHMKFSPFTSDEAYLEVWDHVLCNTLTNKVLGEKPAKRTFGRLFTTKELYGVVQETRRSIPNHHTSTCARCAF